MASRTSRKLITAFLLLSWAVMLFGPSLGFVAHAEEATLAFSPLSGSYGVGKNFTVKVVLNSGGGVGVNAADGTVSFDPSILNVVGVSKDGSIFSLWTSEPSFSNSRGTISFSGGTPSAFTRSGGTVISIIFRGTRAGAATLTYANASALAADGQGTNILGSTGKADFTISGTSEPEPAETPTARPAEPTPAPAPTTGSGSGFSLNAEITSPTHPDPEKWYNNSSPEFRWKIPPDTDGVATLLTGNPESSPARQTEGVIDTKKYEGVDDGISYFHIRFRSPNGSWSQVLHRKIQVDTEPPDSFTMDIVSTESGRSPKLRLIASDRTSGIDHYEVKINSAGAYPVALTDVADNIYQLPPILPGTHTVLVRALDKAGNALEATRSFTIEGRSTAEITNSPGFLDETERLIVEGLADANAKVIIRGESQNKTIFEDPVHANGEGNWVYVATKLLRKGDYELSVRMITRGGAESDYGQKTSLTVTGRPFIDRFGWFIVLLLLFVIAALIYYIWQERRKDEKKHALIRRKVDDIRLKSDAVFAALTEEAEEKFQLLNEETAAKLGLSKLKPDDVLEKLKDALDISQDSVTKEIEDVEQELED